MLKLKYSILPGFFLLAGCGPHPGTGIWQANALNEYNFTKIEVHFKPEAVIYTTIKESPKLYCGWSAASKQNIELECMRSADKEQIEHYYLNTLTNKDNKQTAELIFEEKVIATFDQLIDQ